MLLIWDFTSQKISYKWLLFISSGQIKSAFTNCTDGALVQKINFYIPISNYFLYWKSMKWLIMWKAMYMKSFYIHIIEKRFWMACKFGCFFLVLLQYETGFIYLIFILRDKANYKYFSHVSYLFENGKFYITPWEKTLVRLDKYKLISGRQGCGYAWA